MGSLVENDRTKLETHLTEWLSEHRIPGAAVAVVDGAELAYAQGFGARDLEDNAPATPETLFGMGSCTKSFTAAAVMQLVERDMFAVDDAVSNYLPHLEDAPGETITLGDLLTHTSGMPSDGSAHQLITRPLGMGHNEVPLSSDDDFRRHVEGSIDRRVTDRHTNFYYNSGYTMLGLVVEEVSGQPFTVYVEDHILAPLGMDRSTFAKDAFEAEEDRMTPYLERDGKTTQAGFPFDPLLHAPGGLLSSMVEMATYLRMYIGDGTFDGTTVLSPASVAEMTTPVGTRGRYLDGREVGYGYGLMVEEFLGDRLIGHGGGIAVSNAWFGYLEDAELGVAIACTTGPEAHPMFVGPAILALLKGEPPEAVVPHYRLVEALETAAGEYTDNRGIGTATVERVGGALRLEAEEGVWGEELLFTPTTIDDRRLVCTTTMVSGIEREARFEFEDGEVDLFFERARLTQDG